MISEVWIDEYLPDGTPIGELPTAGLSYRNGHLHGWTGLKCGECNGYGENVDARACRSCAGTGEKHGPIYLVEI